MTSSAALGRESLTASRRRAAELSQGTSTDVIKDCIIRCLPSDSTQQHFLDFGAGRGELLNRLFAMRTFASLTGMDLMPRPRHLNESIEWHQQDLNDSVECDRQYDVVVCSETIEHLENPRHTFRCLSRLLTSGGLLVLTMPNQESIRSYLGLVLRGHFTHFLGECYPAHLTALLRLDLSRLCRETGFLPPSFRYTNQGGIPRIPRISWQQVSLGLLRGRMFSDNLIMLTRKADER